MQYVSATEAKQRLAAVLDAAQSEPIVIKRQNRDVAVMLSPKEFDRLRGMNLADFDVFCNRMSEQAKGRGLTEDELTSLLEE